MEVTQMNKRHTKKLFTICLFMIAALGVMIYSNWKSDSPANAWVMQGDKYFTISGNSPFAVGGDNGPVYAHAIPYDNNRQAVIYAIETTGFLDADTLAIYAKNGNTDYTTLTTAFCGGNTGYLTVANSSLAGSGNSYFVIDDGAGNVGWGEYQGKIGTTGKQFQVLSRVSNFGMAESAARTAGERYLSGTTFPVGSRVYDMTRVHTYTVGRVGISKDNNSGLFAITKASPMLTVIDYTGSSAGTSRYYITGAYQ